MALTLELTTELDAINTMLAAIGEAPVNMMDSGLPDAGIAEQILTRTFRAVQARGWWFNHEVNYPLSPDVNDEIQLPANTLKVDSYGDDRALDVIQRGTRLYNRGDHTYTFTKTIKVEIVFLLAWDELPQTVRDYITVKAARIFQDSMLGSNALHAFKEADEREARAALNEADAESQDSNMMVDSYDVASAWVRTFNP